MIEQITDYTVNERVEIVKRALKGYLEEEGYIDLGMHDTEQLGPLAAFIVGFQDMNRFTGKVTGQVL